MANIPGTNGPETLIGGPNPDTIDAMGGDDILTGGGGADTLTGGTGADIFRDTAAGLAGDRITDFSPGDRIQFTNLTVANGNIHISGTSIVYNGGSIQIDGLSAGRYAIRDTANGAEVRFQANAHNDFDGDGRSDVLWRHDSGRVTDWLGQANSGLASNFANADANAGTDWHVAGTGDFNGDGHYDVLWRNNNGDVTDWLGQANGAFASNFANAFYQVSNSWRVVSTGDFNGDGRDDILWRDNTGRVTDWLGQADGSFASNFVNADANAGLDWHIVGTGDFNGDGRSDILWRNNNGDLTNWLGQANGGFSSNFANAFYQVDNSWHVVGTGDFNADGQTDILWRNDNGRVTNWLGQTSTGFLSNFANADANAGNDWHIVSVGDFNGDLFDDILWRNDNGDVTNWLGQANGSFASNFANAFYQVDNSWHVQDPTIWSGQSGAGLWDY